MSSNDLLYSLEFFSIYSGKSTCIYYTLTANFQVLPAPFLSLSVIKRTPNAIPIVIQTILLIGRQGKFAARSLRHDFRDGVADGDAGFLSLFLGKTGGDAYFERRLESPV